MNKIVIEHYPSERLPEDLRLAASGAESVRVTLEPDRAAPLSRAEVAGRLRAEKAGRKPEDGISLEEAVARVRVLRDEWED